MVKWEQQKDTEIICFSIDIFPNLSSFPACYGSISRPFQVKTQTSSVELDCILF